MAGKSKQAFIAEAAMRILAASFSREKDDGVSPGQAIKRATLLAEELETQSLAPWQLD